MAARGPLSRRSGSRLPGNSFAGVEALFGAEPADYCARIDSAGGAESWVLPAQLQERQSAHLLLPSQERLECCSYRDAQRSDEGGGQTVRAKMRQMTFVWPHVRVLQLGDVEEDVFQFLGLLCGIDRPLADAQS